MKKKRSKSKKIRTALDEDLARTEQLIQRAKDISDVVPYLEDRKKEIHVLRNTVNLLPDDVLEELEPKFLGLYLASRDGFHDTFPDLPTVDTQRYSNFSSTGTTSVVQSSILDFGSETHATWVISAKTEFDKLAIDKSKKITLLNGLNSIRPDLGEIFRSTTDSFEKSKSGIIGLDQAAGRMRDLIQQLWGGLVELMRRKCGPNPGNQKFELKKGQHREKVADCLAPTGRKQQLILFLEGLYDLYHQLSPIAKDALFSDSERLATLYTTWILSIGDTIAIVDTG